MLTNGGGLTVQNNDGLDLAEKDYNSYKIINSDSNLLKNMSTFNV